MVHFDLVPNNPVFSGTKSNTWDSLIRERGYILKEDTLYNLWYTGYRNEDSVKYLGYATSTDGISWTRFPGNPIYDSAWVEDMSVIKVDGLYYMFAEGKNDIAHLLVSSDKIHWQERGNLDIRLSSGKPISAGAYGTPTVWRENGTWYLFYERDDTGVWLATSTDTKVWINVQDEPVLKKGPEAYDAFAVAMNQVIKFEGRYYGYYHATAFKDWHEWSTNVAVSEDLIHWKKYPQNPIVGNNRSSGILVNDGTVFRLYTMHPEVMLYLPVSDSSKVLN
jgi:predicted GH43/DUF377 family glycosyl hydrolase